MSRRSRPPPSKKHRRKRPRHTEAEKREILIKDTAAVFTCAKETACDFAAQCSRYLDDLEVDIVFNDLAHEIWAKQSGPAQDLANALRSLAIERRRHQEALTDLLRLLSPMATDESFHLHLDPPEQYRDLVRTRLFPETSPPQINSPAVTIDTEGHIPSNSSGR